MQVLDTKWSPNAYKNEEDRKKRQLESEIRHRAKSAQRSKQTKDLFNNISPLPEVENQERKETCKHSFKLFCECYFPRKFDIKWSNIHLDLIKEMEHSVRGGGEKIAFAMPRGSGKALSVDTLINTPDGWKTMLEINIGDRVFDETGSTCEVIRTSEVMFNRPCYKVVFNDGCEIVCDAEHMWRVKDRYSEKDFIIEETGHMSSRVDLSYKRGFTERRYSIPLVSNLEYEWQYYDISPYVLGVWLGDGTSSNSNITCHINDLPELLDNLKNEGEKWIRVTNKLNNCATITFTPRKRDHINSLLNRLKYLDLIESKHIPQKYLRGNKQQRLELLQGLMDTDGCCSNRQNGRCEFITKFPRLRDDVSELLHSLSIRHTIKEKFVTINNKICGPYYRISFTVHNNVPVFKLKRKLKLLPNPKPTRFNQRIIVSIEPVNSIPVKCIEVNSKSKLYLCGKGNIPTHNSSLSEALAEWALFYGYRKYVILVGATAVHATEMSYSILTDIETNDLLLEDFPEICYPIRQLEQQFLRTRQQHVDGTFTRISYGRSRLVFPTVKNSTASGSIIQCVSITGRLRGIKLTTSQGDSIRPDFVVIDDPQTDHSAKSEKSVSVREKIINGAIMGLAGPRKEITAIMPCTVIRPNDLAERFLNRDKKPEWQGIKTKLLESMPVNMDMWLEYRKIQAESYRNGNYGKEATEYYRLNQSKMDEGCNATWKERFNPVKQISAIQYAMDLYFTDQTSFFSEYQNEPLIESNIGVNNNLTLHRDKLLERTSGYKFGTIPRPTLFVTSGVDIQDKILYYATVAWTEDFGGVIVDYGTWPKQQGNDWRTLNPAVPLGYDNPQMGLEPKVYKGLIELNNAVFSKGFQREDSTSVTNLTHSSRIGVDANWALSAAAVYSFCREFGSINDRFIACHGRGIPSTMLPMVDWAKKIGEQRGDDWRILPATIQANKGRHLSWDGNSWKSTVAERLIVEKGSSNALMFYGDNPTIHESIVNQFLQEKPIDKIGRNRRINEWQLKPEIVGSMAENHWWDCLIIAAVCAASLGLKRHVRYVDMLGNVATTPMLPKVRKVVAMPERTNKGGRRF